MMIQIVLTLAFFAVAIALLSIGFLITGKVRFRGNRCGRDPKSIRDEECGETKGCELCKPEKEKKDVSKE